MLSLKAKTDRQAARRSPAVLSGVLPLETAPAPMEMRPRIGLSLFWRTFFMLALLLLGSAVAWFQTFRSLEYEPRAILAAQQITSLVNLSRAALAYTDAIARVSLIKTLTDQESVRIVPREPGDRSEPFDRSAMDARITEELTSRLGPETVIASRVNGQPGLWVGFQTNGNSYWLLMDRARVSPLGDKTWVIWLVMAAVLSLAGAAAIARMINQPFKQLSFAASRVRGGDFDASHLDETAVTSEIREVNIGFNRMAEQLAKIEQDRAVMLAGISHDLRTPLARLRLETEMSVTDDDARNHMVADIAQLDAIIDKFLDYARPGQAALNPVSLADVVEACAYPFKGADDIRINVDVSPRLKVLADDVELARVISNLLENARRYGRTAQTGVAVVDIAARARDAWILIKLRDHGMGVPPDTISNLTKPFFRGDTARTSATGAGLGLSIVEKTVLRMGGTFVLSNSSSGGLAAHIRLQQARSS